jgi:IPT/TIG domain
MRPTDAAILHNRFTIAWREWEIRMPAVTGLTPAVGPAAGGTALVVRGEGFNLTSGVTVGGTVVTGQLVSDTELHVTTPVHAPGPAQVIVTVAGTQSPATDASVFTFLPPPLIESIEAASWKSPNAQLKIGGTNLGGATTVTFNGRPSVGFSVNPGGTLITATRPPGPTGSTAIAVTTAGGASDPYHVWFLPDGTQFAIFLTQLGYLALLIGGLIAYVTWTGFRNGLPDPLSIVPLGVPWAGAVGAVTLSVSGLVYHRDDWDRSYLYWHLSRPIIGAIVGTFAYLVVASGVLASGGSPTATSASSAGNLTGTAGFHVNNLFYFVLAFLVGYREATFRTLLQRFSDVLFGPGQATDAPAGTSTSAR